MTLVFCPSFKTVEQALDWLLERGYSEVKLWRGPSGDIRGSGREQGARAIRQP